MRIAGRNAGQHQTPTHQAEDMKKIQQQVDQILEVLNRAPDPNPGEPKASKQYSVVLNQIVEAIHRMQPATQVTLHRPAKQARTLNKADPMACARVRARTCRQTPSQTGRSDKTNFPSKPLQSWARVPLVKCMEVLWAWDLLVSSLNLF